MTVMDAIRRRRSIRAYRADPIPPEVEERLREALRLAPSACNNQPWRFLLVRHPARRNEVAAVCRDQKWLADAPLLVIACGLPSDAYPRMGGNGSSLDIDVAIALDHLTLAATEEGLGTCWIGAFHEGRLKQCLGIPDSVKVVALTPVGYPADPQAMVTAVAKRRKAAGDIFLGETWPANR